MSYYRTQLEDWLKEQDIKANTVLDIGGKQGEVKTRVKSWDVQHYEVLDLPEYNLEEYTWLEYDSKQADLIFCLEVFEYLIDPVTAIRNIEFMLKPGGKAIITFAFCYPHHNELGLDSLRYTEPGIRRLVTRAGLTINGITYRKDRSGLLEAMYRADGMKMARQYNPHDVTGFIVEVTK